MKMKAIRKLWWAALFLGCASAGEAARRTPGEPQALQFAKVATVALAPASEEHHATIISLDEYRGRLDELKTQVSRLKEHPADALALHDSVPDSMTVSAAGQLFPVDLSAARRDLGEFVHAAPDRRAVLLQDLQSRFDEMDDAAGQFLATGDSPASRDKLNAILDQREFHRVRNPSLWEIWRDKVGEWLLRLWQLLRLPGGEAGNRLLIWLLIAIVSSILAIWLKRLAMRRLPSRLLPATGGSG
jgi:hypothetical protein